MCEKVSYPNRNKAHNAMRLIARAGKEMRAYQCEVCYKWHLTSKIKAYKTYKNKRR